MKVSISSLVELVGLLCVLVAAFAVDWRAGIAAVGVAMVVGAQVLESASEPEEDGEL